MTLQDVLQKVQASEHPLAKMAREVTVFNVFKGALKWGPVAAALYAWGVPYVESRAAEYLEKQLIAQGLDPQKFRGIPDQLNAADAQRKKLEEDLAKTTEERRRADEAILGAQTRTESDLSSLKELTRRALENQEALRHSQQLLLELLRRRAEDPDARNN